MSGGAKTVGGPLDWERERKIERRRKLDAEDIAKGLYPGPAKPAEREPTREATIARNIRTTERQR